jgi:hypothetical protein
MPFVCCDGGLWVLGEEEKFGRGKELGLEECVREREQTVGHVMAEWRCLAGGVEVVHSLQVLVHKIQLACMSCPSCPGCPTIQIKSIHNDTWEILCKEMPWNDAELNAR